MISGTKDLLGRMHGLFEVWGECEVECHDLKRFREEHLDSLAFTAACHPDPSMREQAAWFIRTVALQAGLLPASIASFFAARGEGKFQKLTVPSFEVRIPSYDAARGLMSAALASDTRAFLLEISGSCAERVTLVLAAALREGFSGPVFFQRSRIAVAEGASAAFAAALGSGCFNVEMDVSGRVDASGVTYAERYGECARSCAEALRVLRNVQPGGASAMVGAYLGDVARDQSPVDEVRAFLDAFLRHFRDGTEQALSLSKIVLRLSSRSVPGGGEIRRSARPDDLLVASELASLVTGAYRLGGVCLEEDWELSVEDLSRLVEAQLVEVKLRSYPESLLLRSTGLTADLRGRIDSVLSGDGSGGGDLCRQLWEVPGEVRREWRQAAVDPCVKLFKRLGITSTWEAMGNHIEAEKFWPRMPEPIKESLLDSAKK